MSRLSSRPCSRWLEPMGEKGRALIHARCYYFHGLSGDSQPRPKYAASLCFKLKSKFTLLTPKITRVNLVDYKTVGVEGLWLFVWVISLLAFIWMYLVLWFAIDFELLNRFFSVWSLVFSFIIGICYLFCHFLSVFFKPAIFIDVDRQVSLYLSLCPFLCVTKPRCSLELEKEEPLFWLL